MGICFDTKCPSSAQIGAAVKSTKFVDAVSLAKQFPDINLGRIQKAMRSSKNDL